ncbi:hypothetical protein FHS57_002190 [Runella defluvii]|uniref:Uncharacterized protein n=1 Tax=Runella defluvii TaxID=370973 RepID=A0A7W6EQ10_9BACT|nr:hypothetical protein [Runella defluvii]
MNLDSMEEGILCEQAKIVNKHVFLANIARQQNLHPLCFPKTPTSDDAKT